MANLKFPNDLGTDQQGHYMKIVIYPSQSMFGSNPSRDTDQILAAGQQALTGDFTGAMNSLEASKNPSQTTTVCLFVPGGGINSPLVWEMVHDYDEVKLTKVATGMVGAVSKAVEIGTALTRIAGQGTINPKVDVLYSNSQLRKFMFTHFMTPQSADERQSMEDIIKALRMYSAPQLTGGSASGQGSLLTSGYWFVPPAEFEISFYKYSNGKASINEHIPLIGRCVLERIDVNYTQQGEFSTFADGAPTTAMLTMQFREMRVISQADVANGY